MRASYLAIVAAYALLSGCAVGPKYKRPELPVPTSFRAPEPLPEPQAASLADLKWFEVFRDQALQELIRVALSQNYDLRDAVTRVEQARANLGITRSNQAPQLDASGSFNSTRLSQGGSVPLPSGFSINQNRNYGQAGINLLSFEIDLWGRLRRATEAARANLLNAEENRKVVVSTLVNEVATNYFQLLELDYELEISQRTLETRIESLNLVRNRRTGGVATLLDLRQAEQLVSSAAETIPQIRQQIEQTENQISLLLEQMVRRRLVELHLVARVGRLGRHRCALLSRRSWRRTRTSVLPKPRTFRRSASPASSEAKAPSWRVSFPDRTATGPSRRRSRSRYSQGDASSRMSG